MSRNAPGIGRWLSVDPLAEKYPAWSPYNYVMNNPLGMVGVGGAVAVGAKQVANEVADVVEVAARGVQQFGVLQVKKDQ